MQIFSGTESALIAFQQQTTKDTLEVDLLKQMRKGPGHNW